MRDLIRWCLSRLESPRAVPVIIVVAIVLNTPALLAGWVADDHIHRLFLREQPGVGLLEHRPLDLFVFSSGEPAYIRSMMDEGVLGWWTHPAFKAAFLRPVTSLTHGLDHLLWPESAVAAHLHSLLWLGLLLAVVALLYRRFHLPPWIAGIALLLFALDDGHGSPVAFLANRNVLVAAALGLPALIAHDRWVRDRWRPGMVLGPLLLGLGLLAGEAALAVCGYLAAHALFLDSSAWRRRLAHLMPYAAVVVAWRVAYRVLGYGVEHSGIYVDPLANPLDFAIASVTRYPHLLVGQLALPWSDFHNLYPPGVGTVMWGVAVAILAFGLWVLWPLLRSEPVARFWLAGLMLAAIPVCATFPADRLLVFVGVGGMGLLALFLQRRGRAAASDGQARRIATMASIVALVGIHLVLAPLMQPARSYTVSTVRAIEEDIDGSIPSDASIEQRQVVILSSPSEPFHAYMACKRAAEGTPRPAGIHVLSVGQTGLTVSRPDERSLKIEADQGFLPHASDTMTRSRRDRFLIGERVELDGMAAEVDATTEDGRPARVTFRFDERLDDPDLLWLTWGRDRWVPFEPPAVGDSVAVEPYDPMAMIGD